LASSEPEAPAGYEARPASYEDLPAIDALYAAADRELGGPGDSISGYLRWRWSQPVVDVARDTRVVLRDGSVAAFGMVFVSEDAPMIARGTARVHPDHTGRGVGSWLLGFAERGGRLRGGVTTCRVDAPEPDAAARRLLEASGYRRVRTSFDMRISLEPGMPVIAPEGVTIRRFEPGEERAVWRVEVEAFRDHWDHVEDQSFEAFVHDWFEDATLPSSVLVAEVGDRPVGVIAWTVDHEVPYVFSVAVVPEVRRRGIATALLRAAMASAEADGFREMTLSVDAESPTGAVGVYENVGMTVYRTTAIYEKGLA
jgi:mycothiol synthase